MEAFKKSIIIMKKRLSPNSAVPQRKDWLCGNSTFGDCSSEQQCIFVVRKFLRVTPTDTPANDLVQYPPPLSMGGTCLIHDYIMLCSKRKTVWGWLIKSCDSFRSRVSSGWQQKSETKQKDPRHHCCFKVGAA